MSRATKRPPTRGRLLHLDAFSGVSGNMLLGALLDLGAPVRRVREALSALEGVELRMRVERVRRGSIAARHVTFRGGGSPGPTARYAAIRERVARSKLPEPILGCSVRVLERLAHAEAHIHGVAIEDVHFHELGSADTLGDIVGVCAAIDALEVGRISCSALALGHGLVDGDHGRLPLPAPATIELLRGIPTYPIDLEWETVTPTGAALVAELVSEFGALPALSPVAQGFGAGRDREGEIPNVLRATLGEATSALERDVVSVIETNLDDMNPEQLPFLMEGLLDAGALDVSLIPVSMKKGRPGQLLRVLASPADRDRLARQLLHGSSALGVRFYETPRLKLARANETVETIYGRIRVKRAFDPDGTSRVSAEHDSCARAARRHGVPIERVYRAAERAAEDTS